MTESKAPGSGGSSTAAGSATTTPARGSGVLERPKSAVSPSSRAQNVIDAQIAAVRAGSDDELSKTFDKGAVVLARTGHEVDEPELARTLGQIGPHERVLDIKLNRLVAGGTDDAVWLMAELAIRKRNEEPQEKPSDLTEVIRVTELLAASAGWTVVAAATSEERAPGRLGATFPMVNTTAGGPLAPMLAASDQLAAALAADPAVVVVPPDKAVAVGPDAARSLLGSFAGRRLVLDGPPREVRTEKWGFAQVNISWAEPGGNPYRLTAQVIAFPKPDGSWSVVAVQFLAL